MCVESVDPGLPRALARLHPLDRVIQWLGLHPARTPLRLPAANDQPGALEHLKVTRDRGLADVGLDFRHAESHVADGDRD